MKTFLTLLTAITSLSAYTLVGVHAKCPNCPAAVGGVNLHYKCTIADTTTCQYQKTGRMIKNLSCYYSTNGSLNSGSDASCPKTVQTGNTCPQCHSGAPEV
ncbi:hypothetical protein BDN67DRAFT_676803 [Paxillus ammoniavirescens]|nr:hypothetical protein BDN67DRAFT_692223 [Paxillus ammoniavirescens]KAF8844768.1 hypothetical protein BDN67DRAFT_676803 [Paxillus ammoniavirescens]